MRDALTWYVVVQVAGLAVWPLVARALGPLDDRGWSAAKAAGLLLLAWLVWCVCMLSPLPFTRATLLLALAAVGIAAWAWRIRTGALADDLAWFRCRRDLLIVYESVFAGGFVLFAILRSHDPAVAFTEKPMDMAFLNGFLAAQRLPTQDTWLAGFGVPYYYFGYFVLACIGKLAGSEPGVAYNLAAASIPALAMLGLGGLAWNLARAARVQPGWAATGAALAVLLVLFCGHMGTFLEYLVARGALPVEVGQTLGIRNFADGVVAGVWPPPNPSWWFHASRVIPTIQPDGIDEFPFFTALLADLHPHFMAWPWEVLALAVAALHVISRGATLRSVFSQALAALALGSLLVINTWDIAPFWLLYMGGSLLAASRSSARAPTRTSGSAWEPAGVPWRWRWAVPILTPLVGALLFAPYFVGYRGPPLGLGIVTQSTPLGSLLVLFGWAMVLLAALGLFVRWCLGDRRGWYVALGSAVVGVILVVLGEPSLGVLVALVGVLLPWPGTIHRLDAPVATAAGIGCFAALMLLGVEVVYLDDVFHSRMNTVFKFHENAWLLAGLTSGVGLALLGQFTRRARWLVAGCAALALGTGLVYPLSAIASRLAERPAEGLTLDGTAFLAADERAAIRWLADQNGPAGRVVVADGTFDEYSFQSGEFATYSGAAAVLGWTGHELQWRGPLPELGSRQQELTNVYRDGALDSIRPVLERYGVQYVIVGPLERQRYGEAVTTRFDPVLPVALRTPSVTIYRTR